MISKKELKSMIKWTVYKETEYPILVGEFQVAAKHDFTGKAGKKKIENVKDELTNDLFLMLKEMMNG